MRKVVLCFFFFLIPLFLFAKDITATGYASTPAEAQEKARMLLQERIFGTNAVSVTSTQTTEKSGKGSSVSFSNTYNSITFGSLLEVQYSRASKIDSKSYEVTAFIDDSSAPVYTMELEKLSKEISAEYAKKTSTPEEAKTHLQNLMKQVQLFSNYRQVLILMGVTDNIPELPIKETYKSLTDKLESVYTELLNLEEEKKQKSNAIDSQLIQIQIDQLQKEQKDMLDASNQSQLEQQRMYEQNLRESIGKVIEDSLLAVTAHASGFSIDDDMKSVINSITQYNKITDQYEEQISSVTYKNNSELEIGIKSIKNKEYKIAELSNGKPTELALTMRENEVNRFTAQKQKELDSQKELITDLFRSEIQRRYNQMAENCLTMEKRQYDISSGKDIIWASNGYDGKNYCWNISLDSPYLGFLTFKLSYSDVSGQKPVTTISESGEYENYVNSVSVYDSKLADLLSFKGKISVVIDVRNGTVRYESNNITASVKGGKANIVVTSDFIGQWKKLNVSASFYDWPWLKKNPSFNSKADSAVKREQQTSRQQAQTEQRKQEATDINFDLYGINRRLIFVPSVRVEVGSITIDNEKCTVVSYTAGAGIEFAVSKTVFVNIEPFYSYCTFSNKVSYDDSSTDENKGHFSTAGFLFGGGIHINSKISVGTKIGFSKNGGFLLSVYGKQCFNNIDSLSFPIFADYGILYETSTNRICGIAGASFAF